jgi:hypothetical protein
MKKTILTILLLSLPALAFADGHFVDGYWMNDYGIWFAKGTPEYAAAWKREKAAEKQQAAKAEKERQDYANYLKSLTPEEFAEEGRRIERGLAEEAQAERDEAQAERDQVQREIEWDLSNISAALQSMER